MASSYKPSFGVPENVEPMTEGEFAEARQIVRAEKAAQECGRVPDKTTYGGKEKHLKALQRRDVGTPSSEVPEDKPMTSEEWDEARRRARAEPDRDHGPPDEIHKPDFDRLRDAYRKRKPKQK